MFQRMSITRRFQCAAVVLFIVFIVPLLTGLGGLSALVMLFACSLLVLCGLGFSVHRSIQAFSSRLVKAGEKTSEPVEAKSSACELDQLAIQLLVRTDQAETVSKQVLEQVEMLEASCEIIEALTGNMDQSAQMQRQGVDQVCSEVNALGQSVEEESIQLSSAAMAAQEAFQESEQGGKVVADTIKGVERLAENVTEASQVIYLLNDDSKNIGSVLDVIRGIAEQTNLLALNAAIEAARAGDSGRGFAVVADEVRTLASRTQQSTEEIQTTIEKLQEEARLAVEQIERGQERATQTLEQAGQANLAMEAIATSVGAIRQINETLHNATEEQSKFVKSVIGQVDIINEQAVDTAGRASKAAEAVQQMMVLTQGLKSGTDSP